PCPSPALRGRDFFVACSSRRHGPQLHATDVALYATAGDGTASSALRARSCIPALRAGNTSYLKHFLIGSTVSCGRCSQHARGPNSCPFCGEGVTAHLAASAETTACTACCRKQPLPAPAVGSQSLM